MRRLVLALCAVFVFCSLARGNEGFVDADFRPVDATFESFDLSPDAVDVFMAGILGKQETVCIDGVCYPVDRPVVTRYEQSPTMEIFEAPVVESVPYSVASDVVYYSTPITYQSQEVCPICGRVRSASVSTAFGSRMYRTGYGVFGNRDRPLLWRFRPRLRARMGW